MIAKRVASDLWEGFRVRPLLLTSGSFTMKLESMFMLVRKKVGRLKNDVLEHGAMEDPERAV